MKRLLRMVGLLVLFLCACTVTLSALSNRSRPQTDVNLAFEKAAQSLTKPPEVTPAAEQLQPTELPELTLTLASTVTPGPTETAAPTNTPEPTPTPAPTLRPGEKVDAVGAERCGSSFVESAYNAGGVAIICKLKDGFTESGIALGATIDAFNLARDVYALDVSVDKLTITLIGSFKDKYGKDLEQPAFTFVIPRRLANKFEWSGPGHRRLAALLVDKTDGSSITVHPLLREAFVEVLAQ